MSIIPSQNVISMRKDKARPNYKSLHHEKRIREYALEYRSGAKNAESIPCEFREDVMVWLIENRKEDGYAKIVYR